MSRPGEAAHGRVENWLAQPFHGEADVVVEKRDADGKLMFDDPQPPKMVAKFDEVYSWYFAEVKTGASAGWAELSAWLDTKGWRLRAKTW